MTATNSRKNAKKAAKAQEALRTAKGQKLVETQAKKIDAALVRLKPLYLKLRQAIKDAEKLGEQETWYKLLPWSIENSMLANAAADLLRLEGYVVDLKDSNMSDILGIRIGWAEEVKKP